MKFPTRIYIKEYAPVYAKESWYWKSLCIVYCNETLGLMERMLQRCDIDFKSESVEQRFLEDRDDKEKSCLEGMKRCLTKNARKSSACCKESASVAELPLRRNL